MKVYTDDLALRDASTLFDDIFDEEILGILATAKHPTLQVAGFRATVEAELANRLQSDIIPRAQSLEIERLTALVQLGLKIIERGDDSCESDAAEVRRFLHEASQL